MTTTFKEARDAMDAFYHEWFVKKGGPRKDGVEAAFRADIAIEDLPSDVYLAHHDTICKWLDLLISCPEIEKRWLGLRGYRENHRIERTGERR